MTTQLPLTFPVRQDRRLENFRPGANAALIHELRARLLDADNCLLYLWGRPSCGKTHLLHAACQYVDHHRRRSVYLPMGEHGHWHPALLEGLEAVDLVCIDDIEALAASAPWEEAVFHLLNRLRERGRCALIAARTPPRTVPLHLADLKSRLSWGLVYRVHPPTDQDKLAILRQRASDRGLHLPDDCGHYLLRHAPRDIDSLIELLERLDAASLAARRRLTVAFVKRLLDTTDPLARAHL